MSSGTPEARTDEVTEPRRQAEELRARADEIESRLCTGISARWCPTHGDCSCPTNDDGEVYEMDDWNCPLHAPESNHAEGALAR